MKKQSYHFLYEMQKKKQKQKLWMQENFVRTGQPKDFYIKILNTEKYI